MFYICVYNIDITFHECSTPKYIILVEHSMNVLQIYSISMMLGMACFKGMLAVVSFKGVHAGDLHVCACSIVLQGCVDSCRTLKGV